jgi:hypothetical protein
MKGQFGLKAVDAFQNRLKVGIRERAPLLSKLSSQAITAERRAKAATILGLLTESGARSFSYTDFYILKRDTAVNCGLQPG